MTVLPAPKRQPPGPPNGELLPQGAGLYGEVPKLRPAKPPSLLPGR